MRINDYLNNRIKMSVLFFFSLASTEYLEEILSISFRI